MSGERGVGNAGEHGLGDFAVNGEGLMTLSDVVSESKVGSVGTVGAGDARDVVDSGANGPSGEKPVSKPVNWDAKRLQPGESVPESEALSPREFITKLEYLAGLKAHIQHRFEELARVAGHINECDDGISLELQAGVMPSTLFDMEIRTLRILQEELPSVMVKNNVFDGDKYLDNIDMYLLNKRYVGLTFVELMQKALEESGAEGQIILDDPVKFNKAVAGAMFRHLYRVIPEVELMYSEGEMGIVFVCESEYSIGSIRDKLLKVPTTSPYCIGGFQSNINARDPLEEDLATTEVLPVSTMLLATNAPLDSLSLIVNKGLYLHENQHTVDSALLPEADNVRMTRLYSRDARGSRMPEYISYFDLELLKSEVYAFDKNTEFNAYEHLTNRNGPYNYGAVLDGPHAEEYKSLVWDATAALEWMTYQYERAYPQNHDYAHKLAIGMLDGFPVYDWLPIAKAARHYSRHQEYRGIPLSTVSKAANESTAESAAAVPLTTP